MPRVHVQANNLDDVRRAVRSLAHTLGARSTMFPTFGASEQSGRPHVESSRGRFDLVVCERGTEFARTSTQDPNLLLYWIFTGITYQMASDFELAHRKPRTDNRRLMFSKQEAFMALLDDTWSQRLAAEHAAILKEHPFDDLAHERAVLCAQLRQAGHSDAEAWRLAQEQYPPVLPSDT